MYELVLRTTLEETASWPITGTPLLIGRGKDCDIALKDIMVSRHHCSVVQNDGAIIIEDLGSSNTTVVNGKVVVKSTLQPGDTINIGQAVFFIKLKFQR